MSEPNPVKIRAEILNLAVKNRQVVYGQQATNKFLPSDLRRETKDYDVLTNKPEASAKELVERLNKGQGERYKVVPAKYSKTFKVKDTLTGKTIADYTRTTKKPRSYNEVGVRYARLGYSEKKIKNILKNDAYKFRHDKDFDTLQRIREGKRRWRDF